MSCKVEEKFKELTRLLNTTVTSIGIGKTGKITAITIIAGKATSPLTHAWAEAVKAGKSRADTLYAMKSAQVLLELQDVDVSRQDTEDGLWVMRNGAPNFGNPFYTVEPKNKKPGDMLVEGNGTATAAYYLWLKDGLLPEGADAKALETRRTVILANLDKVNNADKLRYSGTAVGNQINHVTALTKIAEDKLGKVPKSARVKTPKTADKAPTTGSSNNKPAKGEGVQTYEVSTKGDKRFSALVAKLKDGRTIEEAFQLDVKGYRSKGNDWRLGKGKPPLDKSLNLQDEYTKLWQQFFEENPKLFAEISGIVESGTYLTDQFAGKGVNQADTIAGIVNSNWSPNDALSIADKIAAVNSGKPAEKHTAKELKKVEQATQYIGKGSQNSSTARYAEVYGDAANTGNYTSDDVVWVSSNGKRGGRIDPLGPNGIKDLLDKAIDAGVTIVMDTKQHIINTKAYNIGEVALAKYVSDAGYTRDDTSGAGVWTKASFDTTEKPVTTKRTVNINGNTIEYTSTPRDTSKSLAGTTSKGIRLQEGLNADEVVGYLLNEEAANPRLKDIIAVKKKVTADMNTKYGIDFHKILKGMDTKTVRKFLLLHEYRHQQQANKRATWPEFTADYTKNPANFEQDANVWALKQLGLLDGKPTSVAVDATDAPFDVDESTTPVKRQKIEDIEEIEETTPEVEETDGSLTKDQQEAANKINAMMKDPKQNIFVLEGEGGTGKSYTVGKVLADNPKATLIVGAATAHSAKDVISDFIEEALKAAGREVPVERKVAVALPKQIEDSPTDTIIVLDEISMINNGTMNNILKGIEDKKGAVKIILLGDRAQLRPIETKDEFKIFGRSIYVDGLKVEGSEVGSNFVTKDASYPIMYKGNDRYADNRNNKLKARIFKDIDSLGEGYHHTLTSQKRQKDIGTYKAIRKFRTDIIEDTAEAENSPKYQKQLQDALTAVYSLPNVNAVSTPASMSDFMNSKDMVDQFKSGKAALVAPTNRTVNLANSLITREFAAQDGQADVHTKYGNFNGQTLRSTSNIKIGDIKVTNNTEVVVKNLSLLSENAIDNIAVSAYPGTVLVDLAMAKAGVKSSDSPVIQVVLNAQGMPQAIRDSLTVAELSKGKNTFNSIVHNDVTDVKLASIRTSSDAVARDYGTVVISVGDKKITVKLSDIVVTDDRVGIIKEHKDELESFFNNFKPTYALTTHKSQGKSFESIVIDMKPVYFHSTVQKLESAYVGLTRSKGPVQVIRGEGDVHALVNALSLEGDVVEDTIYTQDSSVIPRSMATIQEPAIITDNIVVDGVPDDAIAAEVARNINSAKKCD